MLRRHEFWFLAWAARMSQATLVIPSATELAMWLVCETVLLWMVVKVIDDVFFVCSGASFFIDLKLLIHAIISLLEESDGWVQHH